MSDPRILEENVDRIVRRWADPVSDSQVDRACRTFGERLSRDEGVPSRSSFWSALLVAASLFVAAGVIWIIVTPRDARVEPVVPGAARVQDAPVQDRLARLVELLGSDQPDERAKATEEITKIGRDAVPFLKKVLEKTQDAEIRARLETLISELDVAPPSGLFANRFGGRENLVARGGGARSTESAILAALKWLARHQNPDGSWSAEKFGDRCAGAKCEGTGELDYETGMTGLSLLAFLGSGYTPLSEDDYPDPANPGRKLKFGEVVKSGLRWLIARQDREGCIGERGMKYMYNHVVATMALAEAYGMTKEESLKEPTQRAADFLAASQNPGKGWRYSSRCGDSDTSVTGWAVLAAKSAEAAGLKVPKSVWTGTLAWLDEVTEQGGYYAVGYNARGTGKVFVPGKNESFDHHQALAGIGIFARILMTRKKTAPQLGAVNLLMADLPEWKENKIDFYYWYYATLAVYQYDGPEGPMWKKWNDPMKTAIVPNQKTGKDGCQNGSWDPMIDRWGVAGGGRVYATAINALTLETYYRYPIVAPNRK